MQNARILVIGGTSLDVREGRRDRVAGGAGMYTAMSCHRSGADVTLLAPKPGPMPTPLVPVAERVTWIGPDVDAAELPHFEISHKADKGTYVEADYGAESTMSTEYLPADLHTFDFIHVVPLGDHRKQFEFVTACRENGARRISAGTLVDLIDARPAEARAVLELVDCFFMNEEEALRFFKSMQDLRCKAGQVFYVTRGASGVTVVQGDRISALPGIDTTVLDPTGAGDTFCGATLAALARHQHPFIAARSALPLAASMIAADGPTELLRRTPIPRPAPDVRVTVNTQRVEQIASLIGELAQVEPFDFTGPDLPPVNDPFALDYFFATILQQFGFWTDNEQRYEKPLVAAIDGHVRKGAFYLFRAYRRWLRVNPGMLEPAAQAELSRDTFMTYMRADDGSNPLPALDTHLELARRYGRDMLALGLTPSVIVDSLRNSTAPLAKLFACLDQVGGYKEDPLRKKSSLLAIVLQQRPERFLQLRDETVAPIVDYHVMRSCLRTGLIDVHDRVLAGKLVARELLEERDEWAVRAATFDAIERVVAVSGKSIGAVDWFFFQARERCPEMSEPDCSACIIDPVCAHRKTLFQPVRRTTFY